MEGGKSCVLTSEELQSRMYRLCGFAVVVVKFRVEDLQAGAGQGELARGLSLAIGGHEGMIGGAGLSFDLDQLVGAECSLQGRGSDVHVRVERCGLCLTPLLAEDVMIDEEREQRLELGEEVATVSELSNSPQIVGPENCKVVDYALTECAQSAPGGAGNGGKRKRGGLGSGNRNGEGLLHQLQWLSVKNHARVQGRIMTIERKGDQTRALAMLDLYLPPSAWMGSCFWKSGATAAAALSHLRLVNVGLRFTAVQCVLSFSSF